jgi:hypothetical protein
MDKMVIDLIEWGSNGGRVLHPIERLEAILSVVELPLIINLNKLYSYRPSKPSIEEFEISFSQFRLTQIISFDNQLSYLIENK